MGRRVRSLALVALTGVALTAAPAAAASPGLGDTCVRPQVSVLPLGVGAGCPGVRPGSLVRTPLGLCTLNFLFSGNDGARYIGTAGHCLLEGSDETEVAFAPGLGPPAFEGSGGGVGRRQIGRFAYALADDRFDFALIRLDPGVPAEPSVCQFGGPTGLDDDPLPLLAGLNHVGQGRLLSNLVPARTQLVLDSDESVIVSVGLAAPGDSGEPLLHADGRAVGVVAATGPAVLGVAGTGLVFSTRLAPQLAKASQVTGVAYTLQTAPRG